MQISITSTFKALIAVTDRDLTEIYLFKVEVMGFNFLGD